MPEPPSEPTPADLIHDHTADQVSARTARAREVAIAAGRDLGLTVTDPTVLYELFSVVVHLAPAPVAVRVPTVLTPTPNALEQRAAAQRDELAVTTWLADEGFPVVPPSRLVPIEPVLRDGFSMTFWEYVETRPEDGYEHLSDTSPVAELHAGLRRYPGQLPFLSALDPSVSAVRDVLAARPDLLDPADLERAEREWAVLEPLMSSEEAFRRAFPDAVPQPVHGDGPLYNMLRTVEHGRLFGDFELVTNGPVEWDLVSTPPEALQVYDDATVKLGGRPLDRELLQILESTRMLQVVACMSMAPQLPMLAEALQPALAHWRSIPFAGGLET